MSEMRAITGPVRMRTNTGMTSSVSGSGASAIYRLAMASKEECFYETDGSLTVSRTTGLSYDAFNNVLQQVSLANDGYGRTTTTVYTNDTVNWLIGLPTSQSVQGLAPSVPSITRVTTFGYDARGIQNRVTIEPGTALEVERTSTLDAFGNATATTTTGSNIATRTETVTFDARGLYPLSVTNAVNHTGASTFDARHGVPLTQTDPNLLVTSYAYDPLGRQLLMTTPDGRDTTQSWSFCSGAAVACPSNGVISMRTQLEGEPPKYMVSDKLGREVRRSTIGFDGSVVHADTEYDGMGRTKRNSLEYFQGDPIPWMTFTYDALDRPIIRLEPDGSTTTWAYDKLKTTTTNALPSWVKPTPSPRPSPSVHC